MPFVGRWSSYHKTGHKWSNAATEMDRRIDAVVVVVGGWLAGVGVVATLMVDQDNPSALSIPPFHRHGGNMLGDWAADPIPGKRSGRGRV